MYLDGLQKWEKLWSMEFHPQKCQVLHLSNKRNEIISKYFIHQQELQAVDNIKYLGVTINNKLSWNNHINNICAKANMTLNFLFRNFKGASRRAKEQLYKSYVRPTLEYANTVWDPHTKLNIDKLESVQRRAARFCTSVTSRDERVTPLLCDLQWEPLSSERRAKSKVFTWFKAKTNLIDVKLPDLGPSQRLTRSNNDYQIPFCRTNAYKYSFFPSSAGLWNSIPPTVRSSSSLASFQTALGSFTLRHKYECGVPSLD